MLATPLAPTNLAYTHYLLAVAYGAPFHEALAALLPCYWIYWEVGKELARAGSPNPLHARWIGTYGSPEFGAIVGAVVVETARRVWGGRHRIAFLMMSDSTCALARRHVLPER